MKIQLKNQKKCALISDNLGIRWEISPGINHSFIISQSYSGYFKFTVKSIFYVTIEMNAAHVLRQLRMIVSASEDSRMPFTAHDLRYDLERTYPSLCAYLQQRAQRCLGPLGYDAFEVDQVVGHVIEQLTRLHVLGGGDKAPQTALDRLSEAQFYAFLNRTIKNKSIDRLRKRRLPTSTLAELEAAGNAEEENDPLNTVVNSLWGRSPFSTPEEAAVQAASQQELRSMLRHCIEALGVAPHQFQAVAQELAEIGMEGLLYEMGEEYRSLVTGIPLSHVSQHKDHAHKKLRQCLQRSSRNLAVRVAFRLTEYGVRSATPGEITVDIQTLARDELSEQEVLTGLKHLVSQGLLEWHGEEIVRFSSAQQKHLARFFEEGE